jgi:glutaredoxin
MIFYIEVLKGCPYSEEALKELRTLRKKDKNIILETTIVTQEEKDTYKDKHKINTFPNIYYKKTTRRVKIGGYDKLMNFIAKHNL